MDDKRELLPGDGSSDSPPEYTEQPAYQPANQSAHLQAYQPAYQPAVEYDQLLGQAQFSQPGFQNGQYLNIQQAAIGYDQPVVGYNQPARGHGRPAMGNIQEPVPQELILPATNSETQSVTSRPDDHMCLAIFTLVCTFVFGCWCFGIAAFCCARESRRAYRENRTQRAAQYSRDAFTLSVIGIFLAIIVTIFLAWRIAVLFVCSDPDDSESLLC